MTILVNDIKVYQSQDNTDNDSGGGSRTSVEIVDGDVNNLFPDISRIDTVSGDVALRKVFPAVVTTNRDLYYGSHAMIRKTPTDDNVSALLFHTDSPHDKRLEAQDKIESYVIASYEEEFWLFGNHIQGAKTVTFLMLKSSNPPSIGEVYMLREQDLTEQYIRIKSTDLQEITLSYTSNNTTRQYQRIRIICEIEQPLDIAFTGSNFDPAGKESGAAITFATQIADAAKFYSTKILAIDASIGDQVLTVDSIYEQIVPASVTQTPIVNADAVITGKSILPTGSIISVGGGSTSTGSITKLPYAIVPNSMTSIIATLYIDDGAGNIINSSTNDIVGSVDYKEGVLTFAQGIGSGGTTTFEIATVSDSSIQFTNGVVITQGNQNLVYVQNLSPSPSLTDFYLDYRSNGKWYRIQSNADGTLGNDPSIGAGTISDNGDNTSTVSLTLGSLPDIDSTIIYSWASANRLTNRLKERTINGVVVNVPDTSTQYLEIDLPDSNIDPLTFQFQLYSSTESQYNTITSDPDGILIDNQGNSSYDLEGELDFLKGNIKITKSKSSSRFPDIGSLTQNVIIDYSTLTTVGGDPHEIFNKVGSKTPTGAEVLIVEDSLTGLVTFNLGESITNLATVIVSINIIASEYNDWGGTIPSYRDIKRTVDLRSNSLGTLYQTGNGEISGTVSSNGDVTISLIKNQHTINNPAYQGSFGNEPKYLYVVDGYWTISNFDISFTYRVDDPIVSVVRIPATQINDTMENLSQYKINSVGGIKGEISFNFPSNATSQLNKFYSDDGIIYYGYDTTSGAGIAVGVINYNSGEIVLQYSFKPETLLLNFTAIVTDEVDIVEHSTGKYTAPFRNITFKTASTKLSNGSFQLRYESDSFGQQSATTDQSGVITGSGIDPVTSYVDSITGMVSIDFTTDVLANSLKYDAVAETSLPLDPSLLGLNPVRLPVDGRVPVFTAGGHLVIFNEVTTPVVNGTPIADQVDTLARSGQAYIEVIDSEGKRLNPTSYISDKSAGTVTFGNPLVLEDKYGVSLTAPYSIVDRIEDMLLATEVQINGLISLSAPLSNNYTNGVTYVASSLVWGDTGARVYNYFAQEIWTSGNPVWSDVLIGDPTTAQYDLINYPIQIDNQSSTSGRWAIIFKSSTTVDVVEEVLGVVESGVSITIDDVAPINPATGLPYFTMDKGGFGSGWITNNVIRINTDSGDNNMWVIRTVKSGALVESIDGIVLEIRGDAN